MATVFPADLVWSGLGVYCFAQTKCTYIWDSTFPVQMRNTKNFYSPEDKDDDDFVTPLPPKSISKTPQAKRTNQETSRCKNAKQPEAQQGNQYYEFTGKKIVPRIAHSNLINWFATVNEDQKRTVNEMGFKLVLNLKLDSIPIELAFSMIQNYNTDTSTLNVGKHLIQITPEVMHKVMGIPLELRWCDYMIKCLNKSKAKWNPNTHFNGPLALLALVVVNDINERVKRKKDDGYDVEEEEEEEYLAFCNEYKENEEHDFMISKSGNHLILHAVSQFDAKDESGNVVDNNEEDNDSLKAKKQTMKKNIM
ncbi:hypothetical protein L1987_64652 [Smallanthus sonchifolius]|uniref:Uncharacterized protein n=1 Tax=Smallanthus sonchifolius TaxID=185202 RepID=A0ACB9BSI6_9ASTR|nr:hypothetical protein L1987_64652 [Smallanthus sonchifolius]